MHIRTATLNDIERLLQIMQEDNKKLVVESERDFLTENLKESKSNIFVAIDETTQDIIGFIQFYRGRSTVFRNSYAIITDIFVTKTCTESTVSSELIIYMENITRLLGDERIELQVLNIDHQKQALFEKNNYLKEEFYTYVKYINHEPASSNDHDKNFPSASDAIKIKQASINDLKALLPLLKEYLEFYHVHYDEKIDGEFLAQNLRNNKSIVFIALDHGNKITGFTQLYLNRCSEYKEDYYILYDLIVNDKHRGNGIAALLLHAAETFVRNQKLHYIELQTAHDNKAAQRLYERQGYQIKNIISYYKSLSVPKLDEPISTPSINIIPATKGQTQLWNNVRLLPQSRRWNMPYLFSISGNVNIKALQYAWGQIINLNPILRVRFDNTPNGLFQIVNASHQPKLEVLELSNATQKDIEKIICELSQHLFNLEQYHLCLATVICVNSSTYYLMFNFHHIIVDGHSVSILCDEFSKYYQEFISGKINYPTNKLPLFKEFFKKQIETFKDEPAKQYWQQYLTEFDKKPIILQESQPELKTDHGERIYFNTSQHLTNEINLFCVQHNVSLFIFLTAVFAILMKRYTDQTSFIIGYPNGRRPADFQNLVGYLVNSLPMGFNFSKHITFQDLLREIKEHRKFITTKSYDNYPLAEIIKLSGLTTTALFNMVISPTYFGALSIPGLTINSLPISTGSSLYDLMMLYEPQKTAATIKCAIEYKKCLFDQKFIQHFINDFQMIAQQCIKNHEQLLKELLTQKQLNQHNARASL